MKPSIQSIRRLGFLSPFFFAIVILVMQTGHRSHASLATRTWDGGGVTNNWSEAANWTEDSVPTTSDVVIFDGTSTKDAIVDSNQTINRLTIINTYSGTISLGNSVSLTVSGGDSAQSGGTISVGNGSLGFGGNTSFTLNGGTFNLDTGTVTSFFFFIINGGTFNGGSGNFPSTSSFGPAINVNGGTFVAPSAMTVRSFDVLPSATFNHNNGSITCIGSNSTFISSSARTVNNLTLNLNNDGGIGTSVSNTTVAGTLTLNEGIINSGTLRPLGPVSIAPTFGNASQGGGGGNIFFDNDGGASSRPIDFPAGLALPNIRINDPDILITSSGSGTVNVDDLQLDSGSFNFDSNNLVIGLTSVTADSPFTINGGSFNLTSGNLTMNTAAGLTMNNGIFTMGTGNAIFGNVFLLNGGVFNASSGTTSISSGFSANHSQTGGTFNGNGPLDLNGAFNLTGGTFNASLTTTNFGFGFFHTSGGTFNHNGGTAIFDSQHPAFSMNVTTNGGVETFNNIILNPTTDNAQMSFNNRTFRANGSLQIFNGRMNAVTFEVAGDVTIGPGADGDNGQLTFIGTNNQTFTNNGGLNTSGIWTVNKPSGTVTAATDMLLATNQTLNVISGTLYLADGSELTVGPVNVAAAGRLINDSSTTITLGGNLANAGNIFLLGSGGACPQADTILIRSSVNGIQRNWSGSGNFALADVDVQDMGGTASIAAYSSTNSGNNAANWTFDPACPPAVSISPQVVTLYRNQTQTFTAGGGYGNKTFSIVNNSTGSTIDSITGLYTPGNNVTNQFPDVVRATDAFGQFADAEVTVVVGPPTNLGMFVQPPATVQAGVAISQVRVVFQDPNGNTVPNATGPVTVSLSNNPGGSTLTGTLTRNAVNGIATFDDLQLNRPGSNYGFAFTSPGVTEVTSLSFSVIPGPAAQLAFVQQPSETEANVVMTPPVTVQVQDAVGNQVLTATNRISLSIADNPAGGSLQGITIVDAVAGLAAFNDLRVNNFGNGYTLAASAVGLTGTTSTAFNVLSPFIVRNTNDSGPGSLRNAITRSNITTGQQTITFNIPGAGPYTIAPATALPLLSDSVVIDGTTQPGFAGSPIIELSGQNVSLGTSGLRITSANNTIKGLVINRFPNIGVYIDSPSPGGNTIQGNYIGTDLAGTAALPNSSGVAVLAPNNLIGGSAQGERNLISGNEFGGIVFVTSQASTGNIVKGNHIGTDVTGLLPIPNNDGISINYVNRVTVGGMLPGESNIIAFNLSFGIRNYLGTGNMIRGNSIHSNGLLGIDNYPDGPTANDPGDADSGSNFLKNYPVLNFVTGGGNTTINGTLNSVSALDHVIDFFSSDTCDASGFGEGRTYIGSTNVTTNASNLASINVTFPVAVPIGHFTTATATDSFGNTSEFSQCRVVSPSVVTISGRLADNSNAPLRNAKLRLTGSRGTRVTRTNALGNYSFGNVPSADSYTLTPERVNYDFNPTTRTYTNLAGNQTGQDFTGTKNRSSINGTVMGNSNGSLMSLSGVTVNLSGATSRSTIANGSYVFNDLPPGQYTVTPVKEGWTFSPLSIDVNLTLNNTSISHTATQATALEGRIFYSGYYPGVINANGTSDVQISNRPVRLGSTDASHDGRKIVYVVAKYDQPSGVDSIYTANSDGSGETLVLNAPSSSGYFLDPRFSPDGTKIAYVFNSGAAGSPNSIRIRDLENGNTSVVATGSLSYVSSPGWISSTRLAFSAHDGNDSEIYAIDTNGTGLLRLTDNSGPDLFPTVSYDGTRIAYHSFDLGSNTLSVINSDGSGLAFLRNDAALGRAAWSPDGTMLAMTPVVNNVVQDLIAINSTNGTQIGPSIRNVWTNIPNQDWAPNFSISTQIGSNVPVNAGGVDITFTGVTTAGNTTVTPIPPSSAGTAPNGFVIGNLAFEITTTAAYTAPVTVCFSVPTRVASTQTAFNALSLMHNEGGVLVDRTISRDFATRTICGSVTTLSPFVIAEQVDPILPSITGYVEDSNGNPMADVPIELTGAENRFTETDVDGFFTFVNLIEGESYTVQPKQVGFLFNEYSQDFFALTGENAAVFTGTAAAFQISGNVSNVNGVPLEGRTIELDGSTFASTLTDANGDYVFTDLPADGSYDVRVVSAGAFSPSSHSITPLTGNLTGLDFVQFVPTAASVTVGGRVLTDSGRGIYNARVTLTDIGGTTRTALTSVFGYYRFDGVTVGQSYLASVSHKSYQFADPSRVIVVADELTDVDFIAVLRAAPSDKPSIGGRVTNVRGDGLANVSVELSTPNSQEKVLVKTDLQGYYTFENLTLGQTYSINVDPELGRHPIPSRVFTLIEHITEADFVLEE